MTPRTPLELISDTDIEVQRLEKYKTKLKYFFRRCPALVDSANPFYAFKTSEKFKSLLYVAGLNVWFHKSPLNNAYF